MLESNFTKQLRVEIKKRLPDSMMFKTDPTMMQGIPDYLILNGNKWAALECKKSEDASHRPNQEYYVNKMNNMSYASFICPENQEEVLNEVQRALQS